MCKNQTLTILSVTLLVTCVATASMAETEKYPYRSNYPGINTIESHDLKSGLDSGEYIVIDARSQLEYDVIHVAGAQQVAVSKKTFEAKLKQRTLAWSYFESAAGGEDVMVIDLRDKYQATSGLPGMQSARNIPLDVFIPNFVAKKANQDKTLLIFDQVGKQVKWLQYYLEEYGYDKYMFLDGGATSVLKKQDYRS